MDAATAAAEAATNGAEPVAQTAASIGSRLITVSANLGTGFLGVTIAGIGGGIAAQSFRAALVALKG